MQVVYTPRAKNDLDFWVKTGNKIILKKIVKLIKVTLETPFEGIGKPEPLKFDFSGYWSRRINKQHRFVYRLEKQKLIIFSLKDHYT